MRLVTPFRSPLALRLVAKAVDRALAAHAAPPSDGGVVIEGPDPVRVLLIGAGIALGHGVRTRAEALDGHLADMLHRATGRGAVVATRLCESRELEEAVELLEPVGSWDVVVWCPTYREVARFRPRRSWDRAVDRLHARLTAGAREAAGLVVLELPEVLPTTSIGDAAVAHLRRLNDRIALAAERAGARSSAVPVIRPIAGGGPVLDSFYYARCAAEVLPIVTDLLRERQAARV